MFEIASQGVPPRRKRVIASWLTLQGFKACSAARAQVHVVIAAKTALAKDQRRLIVNAALGVTKRRERRGKGDLKWFSSLVGRNTARATQLFMRAIPSQECVGLGATQRMKAIISRRRQDRQKGRQVGRTKRSRSTQQTSRLKRHPGTKRTRSWTKRAPDESYLFLF